MSLLFDAAKAGVFARSQVRASTAQTVRLAVVVGLGCDVGLARAVKQALRPKTASCRLFVSGVGEQAAPGVVHEMADAAVLVAGPDPAPLAEVYRAYRARGVACLVLVALDDGATGLASGLVAREVAEADLVVCDAPSVAQVLGPWLLDALPGRASALGAAFSCCRDAQAGRVIGEAVRSNAILGACTFLKGADTPAMLASEVAMVFKLAGVYGMPLGKDRLADLAALTALSLACKRAAGLALRLPLPACLVKAGVAAAGTYLAGSVARQRMRAVTQTPDESPKEMQ